jgi:glutamate synthase (NADPH/NADH) small chain
VSGLQKAALPVGVPIQTNIPEVIRLLKANKLDEAGRMLCCLKDRG